MEILLLVVHVLVGITVCGLVLLQHGKGADMGAAFGSGSAGSLFGASGSANFLSRTTAILATVFFITSLGLTYLGSTHSQSKGVIERIKEEPAPKKEIETKSAPAPTPPESSSSGPTGSKASEVPK
jgi:preprotein translocase subunit SecG